MARPKSPMSMTEKLLRQRIRNLEKNSRAYHDEMAERGKELVLLSRLLKPSAHIFIDEEMYERMLDIILKFEERNTEKDRSR